MEKYTEVGKYINIIQYDIFVIVLVTIVALISYLATVKLRIMEEKCQKKNQKKKKMS